MVLISSQNIGTVLVGGIISCCSIGRPWYVCFGKDPLFMSYLRKDRNAAAGERLITCDRDFLTRHKLFRSTDSFWETGVATGSSNAVD